MHSPDTSPPRRRHLRWCWHRGSRLWRARPGGRRIDSRRVCRSARTACPHQLRYTEEMRIDAKTLFEVCVCVSPHAQISLISLSIFLAWRGPAGQVKVFPCGQETEARPSNLGLSDGSRMIICFPLWLTCVSEPTVAPNPRRYRPQREV